MTAITLPLKKFPGQKTHSIYFFGWPIVQLLTLLVTIPFTIYIYLLKHNILLPYQKYIALLPIFSGSLILLTYFYSYIISEEGLQKYTLGELEEKFQKIKGYFNKMILFNFSVLAISIGFTGYYYIKYSDLSIIFICMSSIVFSHLIIESMTANIYKLNKLFSYIIIVLLYEIISVLSVHLSITLSYVIIAFSICRLLVINIDLQFSELRDFLKNIII
jgi:hypothetical protein